MRPQQHASAGGLGTMNIHTVERGTMALSRTLAITVIALAMICAFQAVAYSQCGTAARDTFFETLMGGGAEKGVVYVEIPLTKNLLTAAKTPKERWAVCETFFSRVLREEPHFNQPVPVPYWGDFAYQRVDWAAFIASAVGIAIALAVAHTT